MVGTLNPVITDGHLALARSVGAGEYWLSLNNYVMLSSNVQLAGGPIEIFPLDPVVLFYAGVAVNAKAKSPNAARLAANFMLSRDGQGHLAKFGRLPTRGDVQSNPPGIIERLHAKAVGADVVPGRGRAQVAADVQRVVQAALMRARQTIEQFRFPAAASPLASPHSLLRADFLRKRRRSGPGSMQNSSPPPRKKGR